MNMKKTTFSLKLLSGLLGLASLTLANTSSAAVMYLHTPDGIPYSSELTSSFVNLYKNNVSINMLDSSGIEARILEFGPTAPSNAIWVEPSEPLDPNLLGRSGTINFGDQVQYDYIHIGRFWNATNAEEFIYDSETTVLHVVADNTMMSTIDTLMSTLVAFKNPHQSVPIPSYYTNSDACLLVKGTLSSTNPLQSAKRTKEKNDVTSIIDGIAIATVNGGDTFIKRVEADWITLIEGEPLLFDTETDVCTGPVSNLLPWPVLYTVN